MQNVLFFDSVRRPVVDMPISFLQETGDFQRIYGEGADVFVVQPVDADILYDDFIFARIFDAYLIAVGIEVRNQIIELRVPCRINRRNGIGLPFGLIGLFGIAESRNARMNIEPQADTGRGIRTVRRPRNIVGIPDDYIHAVAPYFIGLRDGVRIII